MLHLRSLGKIVDELHVNQSFSLSKFDEDDECNLLLLDIHCFGKGFKMASRFATFSKDEILAINEAAAPTNTKKETKFGLSVFTGQ